MSEILNKDGLNELITKLCKGDVRGKGLTPNEFSNKYKELLDVLIENNKSLKYSISIYADANNNYKLYGSNPDLYKLQNYLKLVLKVIGSRADVWVNHNYPIQYLMPFVEFTATNNYNDSSFYRDYTKITGFSLNQDNSFTLHFAGEKLESKSNNQYSLIKYSFTFRDNEITESNTEVIPLFKYWVGTEEEYTNIESKNNKTMYFIKESND